MKKGTNTLALFAALSFGVPSVTFAAGENIPPSIVIEPSLQIGPFTVKPKGFSLKYTLATIAVGYVVHHFYHSCMNNANTEILDTRLTHLEAAANGMLAKRYAGMECTRSEEFKQQLWTLSDQLLDLRCQVLNPACKKYHNELQQSMLDKIDTLLKRLDALQKFKTA